LIKSLTLPSYIWKRIISIHKGKKSITKSYFIRSNMLVF